MGRNSYDDVSLQDMGDRARTPTYWKTEEDWLKEHHPSALLNDEETDGQNNDSLIAKLKKQLSEGKQLVVFLDYDGTLSPIVSQPDKAFMSEEWQKAVQLVAKKFPTRLFLEERGKGIMTVKLTQLAAPIARVDIGQKAHQLSIINRACGQRCHAGRV